LLFINKKKGIKKMENLKKTNLFNPEKRERDFYVYNYLSGNANKKVRQEIIQKITGTKYPVAQCGINRLIELVDEYCK